MSLVYPASDPGDPSPMAHALVIGVGRYAHLRDGGGTRAKNHFDMEQLVSPTASAQAMANWLVGRRTTTHVNRKVPLGTVELLLSPTPYTDPSGRARDVDEATFANIAAAFKAWRARCDRHEDNIGIFYFCGHGLERESTYLLPSDHGSDEDLPWRNTIDFGLTKTGVEAASRARTLCWLIDACRNNPIDTRKWPVIAAQPLFDPPLRGDPPRVILDLRPTTRNGVALGPPEGGVSYFTKELIRCLDDLGASGSLMGGKWCVTTESLRLAMEIVMSRTELHDGSQGRCDARGSCNTYGPPTILHVLPGPARVLTTITYNPEPALEFASLSVGRDGCAPVCRDPAPERWDLDLEAARYDIRAHFPRREYPDSELRDQILSPPAIAFELGSF